MLKNTRTSGARYGGNMQKNEIQEYEFLVDELKQLIHKKQYSVLKMINAETINLYWEIGEEIYRQQQEKWLGKIYSSGTLKRIAERISRSKRLFGC